MVAAHIEALNACADHTRCGRLSRGEVSPDDGPTVL